jgi:hypothetical protein
MSKSWASAAQEVTPLTVSPKTLLRALRSSLQIPILERFQRVSLRSVLCSGSDSREGWEPAVIQIWGVRLLWKVWGR